MNLVITVEYSRFVMEDVLKKPFNGEVKTTAF